MATTIEAKYGPDSIPITITLTSLANGAARGSLYVDNSSLLYLDALVQVKLKSPSSGSTSTSKASVYAYAGSGDVVTSPSTYNFGDNVTGANATQTLTSPPNLKLLGTIFMPSNATTYILDPVSVAAVYGGNLPKYWGIVVVNSTGGTLDASTGSAWYEGILGQTV